jgi:putative ABC transport system permease protein
MILRTAAKNIMHKPLNALLSIVLLTAGVGIISLLILIQQQFENKFSANLKGVDLVMGAKGSPLQIILSAVYQIDAPTGNIKYQEAKKWMKHPFVKTAIPLAYGDSYMGFNIVGTEHSYIEKQKAQLKEGKLFENNLEVVLGADVAKKSKLKIGDTFFGMHGMESNDEGHKHEEHVYIVVGILQASGKVIDKLILSNIESVWLMHESHEHDEEVKTEEHVHNETCNHNHNHDEEYEEELEKDFEEDREITAVLFEFKNKLAVIQWPRLVNENTNMQIASPAIEINRLFTLFGIGIETLTYLAWGIMFISFLSIFISLYNILKERTYELALMRISGASRFQLLQLVLIESICLCIVGLLAGIVFSRFALFIISQAAEEQFKLSFNPFEIIWNKELPLIVITLMLGIISALIPAIKAYRINISKVLANA